MANRTKRMNKFASTGYCKDKGNIVRPQSRRRYAWIHRSSILGQAKVLKRHVLGARTHGKEDSVSIDGHSGWSGFACSLGELDVRVFLCAEATARQQFV